MTKQRAVLYLRQSIAKEDSISLEIQESVCRTYAQQQGYDVVETFEDPGISGRTFKRPGVTKVMEMIERKDADVIVLWKWSRLSRSRRDWALAADRVDVIGGRIESATEPADMSTSTGRLTRGMLTELAAFESERIGETWKETHARRIRNGLPTSGKPRFGYTYSRDTGYTIDPETGPLLRQLYMDFIAGTGFWKLAQTTRAHGGPMQATGLRRMMDVGFAAGYITHLGETIPGAHEAIISEDEWKAYRVARKERSGRQRAERGGHIYSGLVRCECGYTMTGNNTRDRHGNPVSKYQCSAIVAGGDHTNAIVTTTIEKAVLAFLREVAESMNAQADTGVEESQAKPVTRIDARPKVLNELSKLAVKIDNATDMFVGGDIQKDTYDRTVAKYREQQRELQDRLESLEVKQHAQPPAEAAANLLNDWDLLSRNVELKRSLLKTIIERIEVSREGGGRWNPKKVRVVPAWES